MDPFSNFAIWIGDLIANELNFWRKMIPLKIECAWLELRLIYTDIELAWRLRGTR